MLKPKSYQKLIIISLTVLNFICGTEYQPTVAKVLAQESNKPHGRGADVAPIKPKGNWDFGKFTKFTHLTTEDGLVSDFIWSVAQDTQGFIWIATSNGLNRYGGNTMKSFLYDSDDPNTISSDGIRDLYIDRQGVLWVGTWEGGLNRFDATTEKFTRYQYDPQDPHSLSRNNVRAIYEDRQGNLWIGTQGGGLNLLDRHTGKFTRYQHNPDEPYSIVSNDVFAIHEDSRGNLWIGTYDGLDKFDRKTGKFIHYRHDPKDDQSISNNNITKIHEDSHGILWIATSKGLNRFDAITGKVTRYQNDPQDPHSLSNDYVNSIAQAQDGGLWFGTWGGGINYFNRETESFQRYSHDPSDPYSLSSNNTYSLFPDQNGKLWIATTRGLSILDQQQKPFAHYRAIPGELNSLPSNNVQAIYADKRGLIWLGSDDNLTMFDPQSGNFTQYGNGHTFKGHNVAAIYEDSKGNLWVGSSGGGLCKFNRQTRTCTFYVHDDNNPHSLSHNIITSISEDRAGRLWITTYGGGLNQFEQQTGNFIRYRHNPKDPHSLIHDIIWSIYEDSQGNLWLTSQVGLTRWNSETDQFTHYYHTGQDNHILGHNLKAAVFAIYEDHQGTLWVGTSVGLGKFDPQTQTYRHYTTKDGLPIDAIFGILEENSNRKQVPSIWLVTGKGLSKFNPQTEKFYHYDVSDGLQGTSFFWGYSYDKTQTGQMFFGGSNGFNAFYPEQINKNSQVSPVFITDIQLDGKTLTIGGNSLLSRSPLDTKEIKLSYKDRILALEFTVLNYQAPKKNKYKYRLEGFEKEWKQVDSKRNFVTYTNLDTGNYVFRVLGANNDGVWNETGATLNITVTPPWWETLWFRSSLAILIVGGITGAVRWRIYLVEKSNRELAAQVRKRTQELEESNQRLIVAKEKAELANRAKSTFLSNMSHELRTPLNGILGYAQILKRNRNLEPAQKDGLEIIYKSGQHLLTLINDILDLAKIEVGKTELYPHEIYFPEFLNNIACIIRMAAHQKDIQFCFEKDKNLPLGIIVDEKRLRQILLNLLGNAVKFTTNGTVILAVKTIIIEAKKAKIRFEIIDTGVGLSQEQITKIFNPFEQVGDVQKRSEGTGLGLAITRKLVDLMGGEILVESEPNKGSKFCFELTFPVTAGKVISDKEEIQTREIVGYQGKRLKVLVVDDRLENRMVFLDMLDPLGFEIILAEDGKDGFEKAKTFLPDFILTDLVMPVMTGFEMVHLIRETPEIKDVPIVAVSASVFNMDKDQSLHLGCQGFLSKPVESSKLFALMAQCLDMEWIYESVESKTEQLEPDDIGKLALADMIPPPPEQLAQLYELTMFGDLEKVVAKAEEIAQMDSKYDTFVQVVNTYARSLEDEPILELLNEFIEHQ